MCTREVGAQAIAHLAACSAGSCCCCCCCAWHAEACKASGSLRQLATPCRAGKEVQQHHPRTRRGRMLVKGVQRSLQLTGAPNCDALALFRLDVQLLWHMLIVV